MSRAVNALLLVALVGGCTNRCKQGTALVSFALSGDAADADTLEVEVAVAGQSRISTLAIAPGSTSGSLEIDFASGYPASAQTLSVAIVALHGGAVVGHGADAVPIARGCTALSVRVDAVDASADLGDVTDGASGPDLATAPCAPAMSTQSAQCPAATPICGSDGACRPCALENECTVGVCKPDGACAASDELAFVDNAGGSCTGTHAGTQTDPYCQIQDALDAATVLPFVHVAGSAAPYHAIVMGTQAKPIQTTVVGPGIFSGTGAAQIHDLNSTAVTVQTQGQPFALVLDGVVVQGGTQSTHNGITCNSTSGGQTSLTLRHSLVVQSAGIGVYSVDCSLVVDRATIANNFGGGLELVSGSYVVTNSFIVKNGNGTGTPGVDIVSAAATPAVFAFNTVTGNSADANNSVGGIACPVSGPAATIQSSIVVANTASTSASSQLTAKCVLQNVVTGTDSFPGAIQMTPTFATADREYLAPNDAANTACCVDKVNGAGTPNADHDVDFSRRPKGSAWDVGAHELQ